MSKFFKKAVCPECGREQHGYYINPICLCGHHLRKLNGWESGNMGYSEEEFQTLPIKKKREIVRDTAWDWCDVKWHGGFRLFLLLLYFAFLLKFTDVLAEHTFVAVLAAITGIIIGGDILRIIAKTIYFHWLKKKDILFFEQNKGA